MLTIKIGMLRFVVAAAALLALTSVARANPIPLYNTGVDSGGAVLPDGTSGDPHYILVSVPVGSTTTILVRSSAGGFPIDGSVGSYLGDDSVSRWIGPFNAQSLVSVAGIYDYRTTFDLTGLDPASVVLTTSVWATDNEGLDILLNGGSTGNTIPDSGTGAFTGFHSFSITTGFGSGINTLDFLVNNDAGSTALRVEMTGTADAVPVPEPSTLLLWGTGAAVLALARWRLRYRSAQ